MITFYLFNIIEVPRSVIDKDEFLLIVSELLKSIFEIKNKSEILIL